MPLSFDTFRDEFTDAVHENQLTWEVVGFISPDRIVYPFGTDTKVLSTVFEALTSPIIAEIAETHGYQVESSSQTVYPDATLNPVDGGPKIAIDIKTTYRRFAASGALSQFRYTLGSYTSFLRSPNATKNIKYPYEEYSDHWVIGFLYTRRQGVDAKVSYNEEELDDLLCPYLDVEFFVQEKHRIVGLSPASGNTANIGSFPTTDVQALRDGNGPFSELGKVSCDEYWRNYGKENGILRYSTIAQFQEWQAGVLPFE